VKNAQKQTNSELNRLVVTDVTGIRAELKTYIRLFFIVSDTANGIHSRAVRYKVRHPVVCSCSWLHARQRVYIVTLRGLRVTIVAVEKQ
jgi:hypothetical protein